jgi:N utilization substance protein B
MVFAYYQKENKDIKLAESELHLSLRRSYDLYFYFLLLITELTRLQEQRIDAGRLKLLPTDEDLHPNTRFIDNRFARQVETNETLRQYIKEHGVSLTGERDFVKKILDRILTSEIYTKYLNSKEDNYGTDREFWRSVFRNLICGDEEIEEILEDKCIYWNDDIEIIETFVLKTIKRFDEAKGSKQELLPMYKDDEDRDFVVQLFRKAIMNEKEYRHHIDLHTKNWESERVANMDMVIMQVALAEILNFPKIPTKVTLNEYIDAAKYYSTPKSGVFINGVLDSIVKELKKEKLLLKD